MDKDATPLEALKATIDAFVKQCGQWPLYVQVSLRTLYGIAEELGPAYFEMAKIKSKTIYEGTVVHYVAGMPDRRIVATNNYHFNIDEPQERRFLDDSQEASRLIFRNLGINPEVFGTKAEESRPPLYVSETGELYTEISPTRFDPPRKHRVTGANQWGGFSIEF